MSVYSRIQSQTLEITDRYTSPTINEKFQIELIEGLREINVSVWNSNTLRRDDLIGRGRIQLKNVIAEGFDDSVWHLHTESSRYAGDLKLKAISALQKCQTVPAQRVSDPSSSGPPAYPPQSPTSYHYHPYPPQSPTSYHYHPSPMHYSEFPSPAYPPPSPAQSYQSPGHPHHNRSGSYLGTYPPTHHYN